MIVRCEWLSIFSECVCLCLPSPKWKLDMVSYCETTTFHCIELSDLLKYIERWFSVVFLLLFVVGGSSMFRIWENIIILLVLGICGSVSTLSDILRQPEPIHIHHAMQSVKLCISVECCWLCMKWENKNEKWSQPTHWNQRPTTIRQRSALGYGIEIICQNGKSNAIIYRWVYYPFSIKNENVFYLLCSCSFHLTLSLHIFFFCFVSEIKWNAHSKRRPETHTDKKKCDHIELLVERV